MEQKNTESLSYYNEIQRLNTIVSELTKELLDAKQLNENLREQCDTLLKELELQQRMVDELQQQTYELNKTFEQAMQQQQQQQLELAEEQALDETTPQQPLEVVKSEQSVKLDEMSGSEDEYKREIELLRLKLDELNAFYDNEMRVQSERFEQTLAAEDRHVQKLSKELARLKEHLVEMSESYTREAVQAEERERQLRLKLNEVTSVVHEHDANLEISK
jgi:hypothetical protein